MTTLRYGQIQRSAMNWPIYVARETGLFDRHGITCTMEFFTSPLQAVEALARGKLDVIHVIPDPVLKAIDAGERLSLIASVLTCPSYRLLAASGIRAAAELKGKRLAVNEMSSAESLLLQHFLRGQGFKIEEFNWVHAGPPVRRTQMMKAGDVDATMVSQPWDFLLLDAGCKVLYDSREVFPRFPFAVVVVSKDWAAAHEEEVVRFLRILQESRSWLQNPRNRDRAVSILCSFTGSEEKAALQTYDYYFAGSGITSMEIDEEGITTILKLLDNSGAKPENYVNRSYLSKLETSR